MKSIREHAVSSSKSSVPSSPERKNSECHVSLRTQTLSCCRLVSSAFGRVNRKTICRIGEEIFYRHYSYYGLGATDQHSQNQLYFEGPNDKFFLLTKQSHLKIPFLFLLMRESLSRRFGFWRTFNARAGRNCWSTYKSWSSILHFHVRYFGRKYWSALPSSWRSDRFLGRVFEYWCIWPTRSRTEQEHHQKNFSCKKFVISFLHFKTWKSTLSDLLVSPLWDKIWHMEFRKSKYSNRCV